MDFDEYVGLAVEAVASCSPDLETEMNLDAAGMERSHGVSCVEFEWEWGEFPNPYALSLHEENATIVAEVAYQQDDGEGAPSDCASTVYAVEVPDSKEAGAEHSVIVQIDSAYDTGEDDNVWGRARVFFPRNDGERDRIIGELKAEMFDAALDSVLPQARQMEMLLKLAPHESGTLHPVLEAVNHVRAQRAARQRAAKRRAA